MTDQPLRQVRPVDRADIPKDVRRFILDAEGFEFSKRQHWAALVVPLGKCAAVALFAMLLYSTLPPEAFRGPLPNAALLAILGALGWGIWRYSEWRWRDRLVLTHNRILFVHGWWTRDVPMMSLVKVTDLTFRQTFLARRLGYAEIILETAGQAQALRRLRWIAEPDETYRVLMAVVFKIPTTTEQPFEGPAGGPNAGPAGGGTPWRPGPRPDPQPPSLGPAGGAPAEPQWVEPPSDNPMTVPDQLTDDADWNISRSTPRHDRPSARHTRTLYRSRDLERPRPAETEPVPLFPGAEEWWT